MKGNKYPQTNIHNSLFYFYFKKGIHISSFSETLAKIEKYPVYVIFQIYTPYLEKCRHLHVIIFKDT